MAGLGFVGCRLRFAIVIHTPRVLAGQMYLWT
jgi:hypothetical protein